ncbi:hypothetical protein ABI_22670 [Asticcacaulis biprosthecium C19]|uniref:Lipoprotein n=1 Tax=Asticcacaulis biprosthecium C19 TaxID=715226 RepID=F4QNE7_9CAUL|nr:hypothetical protein [Asticcacaulis biprosthecium]EGF90855.1 hypothetical protein ABI_22670 [Asticcacaulis biprosthecium C19]
MRPIVLKLIPAFVAVTAAVAVAACNPQGERLTADGDELSSAFSEYADSVPPKSFEPALPPVDLPQTPDASQSADSR